MAIRSSSRTTLLLAAGLAWCCVTAAQAQVQGRTIVLQQDGSRSTAQRVGPVGDGPEVRALVVFIRFRDDVAGSESWIPVESTFRGWPYWQHDATGTPIRDAAGEPVPADFETLPPFAHHFVAPTRDAIPDVDSTLSAYFYHQSKPGPDAPPQFLLWGDVLPTNAAGEPIVYVTEHDNAWYAAEAGTPTRRGYGYLTKEVLDHLVERGLDLGDYNLNPEADDVVDQIFLIVRSETRDHPSGVASLAYVASGLSGTPPGTRGGLWYPSPSGQRDPELPDSVRVDWGSSGQYLWNEAGGNVHQPTFYARYGAHEYGHTLWRDFMSTHLWGIDNAVPANGDGTDVFGGLLMGSSTRRGQRHVQLAHTISAYERSLLGWIALDTLTTSRRGITLGDLYTYGQAAVLPIGSGDAERALFLSNRQQLGYFDQQHVGVGVQGERYTKGFPLTGVLAHFRGRRDARDCGAGRHPCVDLLPPDNVLDDSFVDDAYKPGVKTQLSPWTRPSINGCAVSDDPYCQGVELSWAAIDDIRYAGDADSTIVFDFVADVRAEPFTVRADSWLGAETDGATLQGAICIASGATLTVESGVEVAFLAGLSTEPGGAVVFEDEAAAIQPAAVPDCSAL